MLPSCVQKEVYYTPDNWDILRMARTLPYLVVSIKYTDFLDFKALADSILCNTKTDVNGKKGELAANRSLALLEGKRGGGDFHNILWPGELPDDQSCGRKQERLSCTCQRDITPI